LVGIILGGNERGMVGCCKSPLAEGALEEDLPFPKDIFLFVGARLSSSSRSGTRSGVCAGTGAGTGTSICLLLM